MLRLQKNLLTQPPQAHSFASPELEQLHSQMLSKIDEHDDSGAGAGDAGNMLAADQSLMHLEESNVPELEDSGLSPRPPIRNFISIDDTTMAPISSEALPTVPSSESSIQELDENGNELEAEVLPCTSVIKEKRDTHHAWTDTAGGMWKHQNLLRNKHAFYIHSTFK